MFAPMVKTAFIFAAGRGERLRPLTKTKPKALCSIHNIPLIEHHVRRLAQAGVSRVIINHAYLGWQIREHLKDGQAFGVRITYLPEPPGALETAGAIMQALPLLSEPFLTVSADIFTDYPFQRLRLPQTSAAHVVLSPVPDYLSQGDFGLNAQGLIYPDKQGYTFANIACFDPSVFQRYTFGRFGLGRVLRELANEGRVSGEIYQGSWVNITTSSELALAESL